jgi:hypothetical protein
VGLGLLIPAAIGIGVSDYMRQWRLGYTPELDYERQLAFASPHSLVNAVEETHGVTQALEAARSSYGRTRTRLLGPRQHLRYRAARLLWRLRGRPSGPPVFDTLRGIMELYLTHERARVDRELGVLQRYASLSPGDPASRDVLATKGRELRDAVTRIDGDRSDLQALAPTDIEPMAFWLLRFLSTNNLLAEFVREAFNEPRMRHLLEPLTRRHHHGARYTFDTGAVLLALCEDSAMPRHERARIVARLATLALWFVLTEGRDQLEQRERELLDLLAERLCVEKNQ